MEIGQRIGNYVIEERLGEGGIAEVFKVRHLQLDIPYALKLLKVSHPQLQERLIREGKVQARLRHPNVVSVLDVLDVNGAPGLLMEYIDGSSMDEWLLDNKLSFSDTEELFLQVLEAMEAAHDEGVVHRDLKPSNIMIMNRKGKTVPKVCDFGLAKALSDGNIGSTRTGVTMGTPAYMAPEQVRDAKNVNLRADIFSLGTILYELLSGCRPFQGKDTFELLNAVANLPHPPVRRYVDSLPQRYVSAIDGALTKDPELRIPNCAVFREVVIGKRTWESLPDAAAEALASVETMTGDYLNFDELQELHTAEECLHINQPVTESSSATHKEPVRADIDSPQDTNKANDNATISLESFDQSFPDAPAASGSGLPQPTVPVESPGKGVGLLSALAALAVLVVGVMLVMLNEPAPNSSLSASSSQPTLSLSPSSLGSDTEPSLDNQSRSQGESIKGTDQQPPSASKAVETSASTNASKKPRTTTRKTKDLKKDTKRPRQSAPPSRAKSTSKSPESEAIRSTKQPLPVSKSESTEQTESAPKAEPKANVPDIKTITVNMIMDPDSPPVSVVWEHLESGKRYTSSGQMMIGAYRVTLKCGDINKGHNLELVSGSRPFTCDCRFGSCQKK